jgi:hypothetical protein
MKIQSLEARRLLAVLTAGNLLINGTSGDDEISIELGVDINQINVTVNGTTQVFTASDVQSIEIHGGAGNDADSIDNNITIPAKILATMEMTRSWAAAEMTRSMADLEMIF